ncbi:unnamed protein product [Rangifer tarandus platyrhynchus]|uniref:Uncharacterized protein n=1 Tax=Rangifer tarandus platyrhynchus TaxID=3082113 RepID=A0AC59ZN72_RANTA
MLFQQKASGGEELTRRKRKQRIQLAVSDGAMGNEMMEVFEPEEMFQGHPQNCQTPSGGAADGRSSGTCQTLRSSALHEARAPAALAELKNMFTAFHEDKLSVALQMVLSESS